VEPLPACRFTASRKTDPQAGEGAVPDRGTPLPGTGRG